MKAQTKFSKSFQMLISKNSAFANGLALKKTKKPLNSMRRHLPSKKVTGL
ncbi:hypothetical protein X474_03600 [Dethiosulfatarculus sandiegensis]|uniref:Uncharacterized protein n=1 Tax=Dethiosulfatarculus sandiegensis TaxID=1429043 RepID=A0A0D2HYN0_9BACT|nr:hypothetical protein X474_03600 [Dethiosulfatarculus sandiegensis]